MNYDASKYHREESGQTEIFIRFCGQKKRKQIFVDKEARKQALDVLYDCITPHGFRASALKEGYPQIWSRDSMIVSLAAVTTGDHQLLEAFRASLVTLNKHQSSRGLVQLNVNPDNSYVSTENAGAVDCNLWFILGHFLYLEILD